MSVSCSLEVTYWERSDLLALLYVMVSCVVATFPYGVLGHMCYMIVSLPDLFLLSDFVDIQKINKKSRAIRS